MTRIGNDGDEEIERVFSLTQGESVLQKLVPGNYHFDVNLVTEKELKILPQKKRQRFR